MSPVPFLHDFVVILAAAVLVILASWSLRLPPVVGFLLTGVLIGPYGLGLVTDLAIVEAFAEIGVVFLLFSVGLEFSPERLREILRPFLLGGGLQAGLTIAAAAVLAVAIRDDPLPQAVFYGFLVALSSTAIALREYAQRRELDTPQGKLILGILLFQDFLIVPLVLVTPALAGAAGGSAAEIAARVGLGLLVVAAVFAAARGLVPGLLHALVRTRVRELVVLGGLLAGLGMAIVTESFGFSLALGAFLAGILIAPSDYSHQVAAEMSPFRDVFTSLFFIAVGLLLDMRVALEWAGTIAALVVGVVALKAAIVIGVVRFLALSQRVAILTALGLAQVGEFSFVLAGVGADVGLLTPVAYQVFLASAIGTMVLAPFLIRWAPAIARRVGGLPLFPARRAEDPAAVERAEAGGHIVIVGFGVNGRNLARVLKSVGVPYVVLELNPEAVRRARESGEPVVYGDATRRDILVAAGVERARAIVFGISDIQGVLGAVRLARDLDPDVYIIVRTRQVAEIERITAAGANEVVAEEFETSIEIFSRLLERLHVPPNVIEAEARILRTDTYRQLRRPLGLAHGLDAVLDALAAGLTAVFYVREDSAAAGRTLEEADLRRRTGATVIVVVRDGESHTNPSPDFRVQAGDSMVLVGSHAEVDRAFDYLESGSGGPSEPAG